jgi:hypothetical protein
VAALMKLIGLTRAVLLHHLGFEVVGKRRNTG